MHKFIRITAILLVVVSAILILLFTQLGNSETIVFYSNGVRMYAVGIQSRTTHVVPGPLYGLSEPFCNGDYPTVFKYADYDTGLVRLVSVNGELEGLVGDGSLLGQSVGRIIEIYGDKYEHFRLLGQANLESSVILDTNLQRRQDYVVEVISIEGADQNHQVIESIHGYYDGKLSPDLSHLALHGSTGGQRIDIVNLSTSGEPVTIFETQMYIRDFQWISQTQIAIVANDKIYFSDHSLYIVDVESETITGSYEFSYFAGSLIAIHIAVSNSGEHLSVIVVSEYSGRAYNFEVRAGQLIPVGNIELISNRYVFSSCTVEGDS